MTGQSTSRWLLIGIAAAGSSVACGTQNNQGSGPFDNGGGSGRASGGSHSGSIAASGSGGGSGGDSSGSTVVAGPSGGSGGGASGGGASGSGTPSGSGGGSGSSGGGISDAGVPITAHMGNTCLKAVTSFAMKGPYGVAKSSVDLASYLSGQPTPTTYSVFAPTPLETTCKHPVVIWGNGTGVTGSSTSTPAGACTGMATIDCLSGTYDFFNVYAASFGIIVLASDNSNVGSGVYHKAAYDYMVKQNNDSSSPFYQKLSGRFGVSGHSQGGIGATAATNLIGPACQAEVCVAGGGGPLKTTAFLCLTGTKDQAEAACKATYGAIGAPQPAFLADWDGGDHVTTETLAGYVGGDKGTVQMMKLYAAWFRCFLADDQVACKMFEGGAPNSCGMCKDPGWADLQSKNL